MKEIVFALMIALACLPSHAQTIVDWVIRESHSKLDYSEAYRIVDTANEMARAHGVDPTLVLAVMRQESGFRVKVKSRAGAQGIMQVIPKWHPAEVKGRSLYSLSVGAEVGTLVLAKYIRLARGDVKHALHKYSGVARRMRAQY